MKNCPECRLGRRQFLTLSVGAAAGAGLAAKFPLAALGQDTGTGRARSVILLWMAGGPSQLDTFDPKPGAETGGPFRAIETSIDGARISEHLPLLAREMHRGTLVRTVHSNDPNHETAVYSLHTGYRRGRLEYPSVGSIMAHELGHPDFELPYVVQLGGEAGPGPAHLGARYASLVLENLDNPLDDITRERNVDATRQRRRLELIQAQNAEFAAGRDHELLEAHSQAYERAVSLTESQRVSVFDYRQEPQEVRDAYGESAFGRACLIARRLVQEQVPFIEVQLGGWDTHENNFEQNQALMGQMDPAMSTLLRDLDDRGLLDSTLVVWMGEFGRTPTINENDGRDHFTDAWSVMLAGAGIARGRLIGRTDAQGRSAVESPVSTYDLLATLYHCCGIDTSRRFYTRDRRPVQIMEQGTVVRDLLA